jgi:hypothetical protein
MIRVVILFSLVLFAPAFVVAQELERRDTIPTHSLDSIGQPGDEITRIRTYADRFDPQKALLLSAILPGAGQVYNKKYWKVPIIYGGFIGLGYFMHELHGNYKTLKDMLFNILNEPDRPIIVDRATGLTSLGNYYRNGQFVSAKYGFTTEQLRSQVNKWQRDRDFTVMLTAGWYLLQMVDAHVDAHLKEFDVNPQLKVSIEPSIRSNVMTGRTTGMALTLKF